MLFFRNETGFSVTCMFLKLRFNHNYPEFNSIPFSKDSESGKGEHVDLDRFPMRIYFFCLRKKTSVII